MNKVDLIERSRLRKDIPPFRAGDQVKVFVKVREGDKVRDQLFEGVVIAKRGGGLRESFTVRKISFGVGVERTFPIHAPAISKLEVVRHGKVRRAKLYYLRELSGRQAKINERRTRIKTLEDVQAEEQNARQAAEDATPPSTDEEPVIEAAADAAPSADAEEAAEVLAASDEAEAPEAEEPAVSEPAAEVEDKAGDAGA